MITREIILDLITEEKERYAEYTKLCTHYQAVPDQLITAKRDATLATLQNLLKDASNQRS